MLEDYLKPSDQQFDSGFGATAQGFYDAAKALDTDKHKKGFGMSSTLLPTFYLYRHAIELFLKSGLTMVHRRFCSDFPKVDNEDFPLIEKGDKKSKIFTVHSIQDLQLQLERILSDADAKIKEHCRTDWTKQPDEIEEWINIIESADKGSTMFRYPMTKEQDNDTKKASYKPIDPASLVSEMSRRNENKLPPVMVMAMQNEDGEIVESFIHDASPMPEVLNALRNFAESLSGMQFGMQYEFLKS